MKLNDNEIEAIRYMEKEIYYFREAQESADKEIDDRSWYKKLYDGWENDINMRETILKLINKLQHNNSNLLRKLRNRIKEVNNLKKYSLYKKEFSRLNNIIKEKDKQIDLMGEVIFNNRIWNRE